MNSQRKQFNKFILSQWFLIGVFISVLSAIVYPKLGVRGGVFRPELTIPYAAVPLVYLLTFLSKEYSSNDLDKSNWGAQWRVSDIVIIIITCFFGCPILAYAITRFAVLLGMDEWIIKGIIAASCMPPPQASSVVLCLMHNAYRSLRLNSLLLYKNTYTRNFSSGLFDPTSNQPVNGVMLVGIASVVGGVFGCVATPVLLFLFLGSAAMPAFTPYIISAAVASVSLVVGHVLQKYSTFSFKYCLFATQLIVLFSLYCSLCDVFVGLGASLQPEIVLQSLALVFILQFVMILFSWFICKIKDSQQLLAPLIFCGTHKSISLGYPLLTVMYGGMSHHSIICLPILLYHSTQSFTGALLISSGLIIK